MSNFNQGNPAVSHVISTANCLVFGNTSSGNALSVQQLGAGNVFSFSNASGRSNVFIMNNLGQVGLGTTSPGWPLDVLSSGSRVANFVSSANGSGNIRFQCTDGTTPGTGFIGINAFTNSVFGLGSSTAIPTVLYQNGTEYMRIHTNGYVGIGNNNPGYTLDVTGNINLSGTISQGGTPLAASQWTTLNSNIYYLSNVSIGATTVDSKYKLIVTGNVAVTKDVFVFYSDDRLKTKLGLLENALDKVCSLEGFTYVPNDLAREIGATDDDRVRVGLSAQSVQRVLPEAVGPAPFNDQYLTVQYEKLVPLLVEAIKELKKSLTSK